MSHFIKAFKLQVMTKTDSQTEVSIVKVENHIEPSVRRAISLVGGMASLINKDEKVFLKPNFVAPRDASNGVTTDFEIIRVVAEEVRRCGGVPILFETPAMEFEKQTVYDVLGVFDFARKNNIHLHSGFSDLIKVPVPDGNIFKSLFIPRILHRAKIINLPKLKTHVSTKMSCCMKNLIGLLPDSEKRSVHIWGVHSAIADICRVFRPILNVVDAISCLEGDGPTYGQRVDMGLVIAGKDMVSVDKICSQVIDLPWQSVKYLRLASQHQMDQKIKVLGEPVEHIHGGFKIPRKSTAFHLFFRLIYIFDVLFSKIVHQPLNQFLYSTGYVGTHPKIVKVRCNRCGDCTAACPIGDVLKIETHSVDHKRCIRCLNCYAACNREAIFVKGFTHPEMLDWHLSDNP